ncbi:Uncharacterized protein GBIM_13871 [Gryllus bimaculatus]|nr:Uncharacterized protein GBIM_13871 [Gryllus bimaculatus]
MEDEEDVLEEAGRLAPACNTTEEDARTAAVRYYCYGVALPAVCALGILGNALNLLVLTRRNMKGIAYVYMRGQG